MRPAVSICRRNPFSPCLATVYRWIMLNLPPSPSLAHPPCTRRLAARLEVQGCVQPEVCVMAGGWKRFRRELEMEDFELVEDFTD